MSRSQRPPANLSMKGWAIPAPAPWANTKHARGFSGHSRSADTAPALPVSIVNCCGRNPAAEAGVDGDPGMTRTCDLRFRKPSLYPAELRDRSVALWRRLSRHDLSELAMLRQPL